MLWISWIVAAVVLAALFSVVKTMDRLTYSMEVVDARLDTMAKAIAELSAVVSATNAAARLSGPGASGELGEAAPAGAAQGRARVTATMP